MFVIRRCVVIQRGLCFLCLGVRWCRSGYFPASLSLVALFLEVWFGCFLRLVRKALSVSNSIPMCTVVRVCMPCSSVVSISGSICIARSNVLRRILVNGAPCLWRCSCSLWSAWRDSLVSSESRAVAGLWACVCASVRRLFFLTLDFSISFFRFIGGILTL